MFLYGVGDTFRTGTHKAMIFEWLRLQGRSDERTSIYGLTRSWSQIGSALSGIIAAGFVLISGSYDYVFYFAVIPYAVNLLNLATYPTELDGEHQKASSLRESLGRLKKSLKEFDWQFAAAKIDDRVDGLGRCVQCHQGLSSTSVANGGDRQACHRSLHPPLLPTRIQPRSSMKRQTTALLIGPVYAILFLLSAWASRNSQRLVDQAGNESAASKKLWLSNLLRFRVHRRRAWWQINVLLVVGLVDTLRDQELLAADSNLPHRCQFRSG